jgi:hypothetical protein
MMMIRILPPLDLAFDFLLEGVLSRLLFRPSSYVQGIAMTEPVLRGAQLEGR